MSPPTDLGGPARDGTARPRRDGEEGLRRVVVTGAGKGVDGLVPGGLVDVHPGIARGRAGGGDRQIGPIDRGSGGGTRNPPPPPPPPATPSPTTWRRATGDGRRS